MSLAHTISGEALAIFTLSRVCARGLTTVPFPPYTEGGVTHVQ